MTHQACSGTTCQGFVQPMTSCRLVSAIRALVTCKSSTRVCLLTCRNQRVSTTCDSVCLLTHWQGRLWRSLEQPGSGLFDRHPLNNVLAALCTVHSTAAAASGSIQRQQQACAATSSSHISQHACASTTATTNSFINNNNNI